MIYLDYNATTPVDPRVAEAMLPYLMRVYGNPSSGHALGREAREAVERARDEVATCLGCDPGEVFFTSGGSEADNWAIRGVVEARGGGHVVVTAVEHPAVLEPVRALERSGRIRLTVVGVDAQGLVDPDAVAAALAGDTVLVSVMLANNEVGTLQPVAEIAARCRDRGVPVHTDAAQAVGKIPVDMGELGVDLLTVAGHKLYAPKGVGALVVRRGVALEPLIRGAAHERGLRAGTENVAALVALGKACALAAAEVGEEGPRLAVLRNRMESALAAGFPAMVRHGHPTLRLPNTASVAFPGVDATLLLARLGEEVAASAGAACHTDAVIPSHVLAAMGVDTATAMATVRFSVGRFSTAREVDDGTRAVLAVAREIAGDRAETGGTRQTGPIRLTSYTHGLGCACKLQPDVLERVLRSLPRPDRAEVLVGADTSDDACAWRLPDGSVLVQTLDFFTPVVDDPRLFGAIAAANALSDIYAMGARPLTVMNLIGFPRCLPQSTLVEILRGGAEKVREAGAVIVGGHTLEDDEPKYGMAVTGLVDPARLVSTLGALPGDALILTKPLGTGILATALKGEVLSEGDIADAIAGMEQLNKAAAEIMLEVGIHACTDITGFGLLGHLLEMAEASRVRIEIEAAALQVYPHAVEMAAIGLVPEGSYNNRQHYLPQVVNGAELPPELLDILADPQTSGGLIIAVAPEKTAELRRRLRAAGLGDFCIGTIREGQAGTLKVT